MQGFSHTYSYARQINTTRSMWLELMELIFIASVCRNMSMPLRILALFFFFHH